VARVRCPRLSRPGPIESPRPAQPLIRDENHEVSQFGIRGCGSYDVRRCCGEWDNQAASYQGRHLIAEWAADM